MLDVAVTLVYLVITGTVTLLYLFQKGNNELQISLEDATLQRSSFTDTGIGAAGHSYNAEAIGCRG